MNKIQTVPIIILLIAVLSIIAGVANYRKTEMPPPQSRSGEPKQSISQVSIENVIFNVELAQMPEERRRGLSKRKNLCPQCGMLFIFPREDYYPFWMKDTLIPLDIIWIDENWRVIDFVPFAQPQGSRRDNELPIYYPKKPAQYVLEVPGGTTTRIRGFKIGSEVKKK